MNKLKSFKTNRSYWPQNRGFLEGSIDSIHPFAKMTWILVKYPFRNFTSSGQRNSLSLHLFDLKFLFCIRNEQRVSECPVPTSETQMASSGSTEDQKVVWERWKSLFRFQTFWATQHFCKWVFGFKSYLTSKCV